MGRRRRPVLRRFSRRWRFANGGDFDHDMRRSGQNRCHLQILARSNARFAFTKLAQFTTLVFEALPTWGFAEASHPSKRLGGLRRGLAGMGFANGGRFDHLDADCGQNCRHSQSRAWRGPRLLAPVKRYEHLTGANSLMKMRKTQETRS